MPEVLTTGCILNCSMGTTPSVFEALKIPGKPNVTGAFTMGLAIEVVPGLNIKPFGMCNAVSNPTTVAATAAAQGVHTPGACLPVIPGPWAPPSAVANYGGNVFATVSSKCMCVYLGEISVAAPIQTIVTTT